MKENIKRVYVEKKLDYDNEAKRLYNAFREYLGIKNLEGVRVIKRYDIMGLSDEEYEKAKRTILSEPPIDIVYDEELPIMESEVPIAVEYLPGQYDQRADSAAQCIQILTLREKPLINTAKIVVIRCSKKISDEELNKIKRYLINPVDSREASLEKPATLKMEYNKPEDVEWLLDFNNLTMEQLESFRDKYGLAMNLVDLKFCQDYFKNIEKRAPSITEIKVLDTYWSDHCRHTTFNTLITEVEIEESLYTKPVKRAYEMYLDAFKYVYPEREAEKELTLMNIATMSMKELRKAGKLEDMEDSGEVNACSIIRKVVNNGDLQDWYIMFKNETHNHPTEIEPYGGAATCLGGAIRDPLSGRAYVYQAMRVSGCGNPFRGLEETLPGKLPQRKITIEAALGYSSYGNQIGVPTGLVTEIYHDRYIAKRMEVGAVIGAVPCKNVVRLEPEVGDIILLVGGRTGRDGIGGATGSSKAHKEDSIYTASAEVQKGNPPEERKLQRLFRNPEVAKLIKRSNDFGAGGVSVAIGELAKGLEIYLDNVPKKYEGLDGTELAISESQERMAVVVSAGDVKKFKEFAHKENLEATEVAKVSADNRLRMYWNGKLIVDLDRSFIDTHGVRLKSKVKVITPSPEDNYFKAYIGYLRGKIIDIQKEWLRNLRELNVASQKGLSEWFDSTVGANTVLMPYGGKYQATPIEAMVAKIPVFEKDTTTVSIMSFGFNPYIAIWSPFHSAVYAVIEAVSKIVATGGDYKTIRVSLQEYFERLGNDSIKWGKPFASLLGAYYALTELGIASIGGKDSMSGTFKDLDVPPTLIAFAVTTAEAKDIISPELKSTDSILVFLPLKRTDDEMPIFDNYKRMLECINGLIKSNKILSARTVRNGGIAAAISVMAFGNKIGIKLNGRYDSGHLIMGESKNGTNIPLFAPLYGSFILEMKKEDERYLKDLFKDVEHYVIGTTMNDAVIEIGDIIIKLDDAMDAYEATFETLFPTRLNIKKEKICVKHYKFRYEKKPAIKFAKPRVLVPVFPGTNCEYETQAACEQAGAIVDSVVFRNLSQNDIHDSIRMLTKKIKESQIIVLPGGFSAGDEPDGSGKFIAAVFRNSGVKDAVMELLYKRDGLILGICNGFQALIKIGLVPYGEIRKMDEESPTLTYNQIGHHVSRIVRTKIVSVLSPWFCLHNVGDMHLIPVSHGEGRFIAPKKLIAKLIEAGQIATQYVDDEGNPSMESRYNPNGSMYAIEAISSPDGRVLGKMAHTERVRNNLIKNIPNVERQLLFESGVFYFS
jgi:phosphoribosylformylglycinamidine synthase